MSLLIRALKQAERDNSQANMDDGGESRPDVVTDELNELVDTDPPGPQSPIDSLELDSPIDVQEPAGTAGATSVTPGEQSLGDMSLEDLPQMSGAGEPITLLRHAQPAHDEAGSVASEPLNASVPSDDSNRPPVENDRQGNHTANTARAMPLPVKKGRRRSALWIGVVVAVIATGSWMVYEYEANTLSHDAMLAQPIDRQAEAMPATVSLDRVTAGPTSSVSDQDPTTQKASVDPVTSDDRSTEDEPVGGTGSQIKADEPNQVNPPRNSPRKAKPVPARSVKTPASKRAERPTKPTGIRFRRTKPAPVSKQELLNQGYRALVKGDSAAAMRAYRSALAQDRNLRDAWIGLATLAARRADRVRAEQHYRRALQIDPNDAVAKAGLATLVGDADQVAQESRLRNLAAARSSGPAVQFALGNTLAAQGRWMEAQQAYFRASSADPDQPDYAFNLAVALERIRQPGAALGHYQKAIQAARGRPAQFSLPQAQARIQAIQSVLAAQPTSPSSGAVN